MLTNFCYFVITHFDPQIFQSFDDSLRSQIGWQNKFVARHFLFLEQFFLIEFRVECSCSYMGTFQGTTKMGAEEPNLLILLPGMP